MAVSQTGFLNSEYEFSRMKMFNPLPSSHAVEMLYPARPLFVYSPTWKNLDLSTLHLYVHLVYKAIYDMIDCDCDGEDNFRHCSISVNKNFTVHGRTYGSYSVLLQK